MAGSTSKKVLVRRFDREPLVGYVNPQSYLQAGGLELLTPAGTLALVQYEDVKSVSFVKDFESAPQVPERKVFNTRPKMDGLWIRMKFRDGEIMDGVLPNNLLQLDSYGFTVIPPDPYSNNQRVFVPRAALAEVQVLGVVGSPLTHRKVKPVPKEQIELFEK